MSGLIPQHFIDDMIDRADIVEVLGKRIQLRKAGKEYKAVCPFHDEKTPSFTVSPGKGFYHCFGCGAHGTAIGFLMEYEHMNFREAVESLASTMGIEVPEDEGQRPVRKFDELYGLLQRIEQHYQSELKSCPEAVEYLKQRGIDGATAKRFGIGYAPAGWRHLLDKFGTGNDEVDRLLATGMIIRKDNGKNYDRFRERVMFPIRDARGRCIGFGGRVIGNDEPKYLNSPETVLFHKGRELYGLYEARQALRNVEQLLVVEGYMDVVGLARHGIDFAVATLGTATTDDQISRLFRLTEDVMFCFDGDRAGRAAAWKALETALPQLREGRQIRFVFLPDGQDPDSCVRDEGIAAFETALSEGLPLSEFLIEDLAAQVDMESVDGRARLAEMAKSLLARIPPGIYRELLTQKLADRVGLSATKLDTLIGKAVTTRESSLAKSGGTRLRPTASSSAAGKPSVVRRAITLLLHYPEAAANLDSGPLAAADRPGVDLLREIIETVRNEPTITTAGLLERWRNHEQGRHLGKLAAVEMPAAEEFDAAAELQHCIHQLAVSGIRGRVEILIEKQRLEALSDEEKEELRALIGSSGISDKF